MCAQSPPLHLTHTRLCSQTQHKSGFADDTTVLGLVRSNAETGDVMQGEQSFNIKQTMTNMTIIFYLCPSMAFLFSFL